MATQPVNLETTVRPKSFGLPDLISPPINNSFVVERQCSRATLGVANRRTFPVAIAPTSRKRLYLVTHEIETESLTKDKKILGSPWWGRDGRSHREDGGIDRSGYDLLESPGFEVPKPTLVNGACGANNDRKRPLA